MSSGEKASLPAGTGVCVVKTLDAATILRAALKSRPSSRTHLRMRSSPRMRSGPRSCDKHGGLDSHRLQRAEAAPCRARFPAARGSRGRRRRAACDGLVLGRILGDVRVEQVERDAADGEFQTFAWTSRPGKLAATLSGCPANLHLAQRKMVKFWLSCTRFLQPSLLICCLKEPSR